MKLLYIFAISALVGISTSIPAGFECLAGAWSEWGSCQAPEVRPGHSRDVKGVVKEVDDGREAMSELMKMKQEAFAQPNLRTPTSQVDGPVECVDGFAGIYPCSNIDQLSFVSVEDLEPTGSNYRLNDIWGWTDPEDGGEYAIVGLDRGSAFVRVTDPEAPEVLGFLFSTNRVSTTWRDMKVVNDHVFIISESSEHGMQVYDLRQLRDLTADNTRVLENTAFYDGVSNTHNIVSNPESNTVFLVGSTRSPSSGGTICSGGLHMVDVSDPANPTYVGCFGDDGYVHDAQCVTYAGPDTRYTGREICYCYNEDSFTIVDVTDKANAVLLSRAEYEGYAYTHQGACTEDFTIALLDDELDESRDSDNKKTRTYMWDVRDLENPTLENIHYHINDAIDHNQYVLGQYTYQSNYESGLRVLWIDQENYDLVEVAYFDVFPDRTTANFAGSWSNYPYYNSGAVAVTSIEYGLFMVRVNLPDEPPRNMPQQQQYRHRDVIASRSNNNNNCPALEDYCFC